MTTHEMIKKRLMQQNVPYKANDNICEWLIENEEEDLITETTSAVAHLLDCLVIDYNRDSNTIGTPRRMANMMIKEIFSGRYQQPPIVTDFPNRKNIDQIYTIGPVTINSTCSHHFVPITGSAWLGLIPSDRVIGLSKFKRLADFIFLRPQIQEEATVQLADIVEKVTEPKGLALIVEAKHHCISMRGVKDTATKMTTSIVRGIFFENAIARSEFLSLIGR